MLHRLQARHGRGDLAHPAGLLRDSKADVVRDGGSLAVEGEEAEFVHRDAEGRRDLRRRAERLKAVALQTRRVALRAVQPTRNRFAQIDDLLPLPAPPLLRAFPPLALAPLLRLLTLAA